MTEPTLTIGRLFMEEMLEWVERCPSELTSTQWKDPHYSKLLPASLREALGSNGSVSWTQLYSRHEMEASLAKVKLVGYSEQVWVGLLLLLLLLLLLADGFTWFCALVCPQCVDVLSAYGPNLDCPWFWKIEKSINWNRNIIKFIIIRAHAYVAGRVLLR